MAESEAMAAGNAEAPPPRRPPRVRYGRIALLVLGGLLLLVGAVLIGVNTGPGRALLVSQVAKVRPASGLTIGIGRIDGSLYGRMTVRDLAIGDTRGVFLTVARAELDWRPFLFLTRNRLHVNSLVASDARLARLPELRPTPTEPDQPLLPGFDIFVGRFRVERLVAEAPVAGRRAMLAAAGRADIRDGRALVELDAGASAGDRLIARLDAEPDRNRLAVKVSLAAPAGGLVTGMAGLRSPLQARIAGHGDWADWRGRLDATLAGQPLAGLALTARDGRFGAAGAVRAGALLTGPAARLLAPELRLDLRAEMPDEVLQTRFSARSAALALTGSGGLDRSTSRLRGVRIEAALLRPGEVLDNLAADDLRLRMTAEGPMAGPDADIAVTAGRVAVGGVGIERLDLRARARLSAEPATVDLTATAARVIGVPQAADSVLRNVRVAGPFLLRGTTIETNALVIRSDKLNLQALVSIDPSAGRYTVVLNGALSRFDLPGVGLLDVRTNMRALPAAGGTGTRVVGRVDATVTRISNGALQTLAGGPIRARADIDALSTGAVIIRGLEVRARDMQLAGGGTRMADGRLNFRLAGRTKAYGPVVAVAVGPPDALSIALTMQSPGLGVGLRDLNVRINAVPTGYAVAATGGSDYGPVNARVAVAMDPLAVQIISADAMGLRLGGRIEQAGEAHRGRLTLAGPGLNGTMELASTAAGVQQARLDLRANQAQLPLNPAVSIASGYVTGTATLGRAGPSVDGRFDLQGVRRGELLLHRASGVVDYRAGSGSAALALSGRQNFPFDLRSRIGFAPARITVAADGSLGQERMRLAQPAVLEKLREGWRLHPARLELSRGTFILGGLYGDRTSVDVRAEQVDLGLASLVSPTLELAGRLSGTLSATLPAGNGLPEIRSSFSVRGLRREALALASLPIDIDMAAAVRGATAAARAVMRREGRTIGQAQAQLSPIPGDAGDSLSERFLSAPIRGQIRFNGPAEALFALAGIEQADLRGPLRLGANIHGQAGNPVLSGRLGMRGARFEAVATGTVVSDIRLDARFNGSRLELREFSGRTPNDGALSGIGTVDLALAQGLPMDLRFQLDRARLLNRGDMSATLSGPVAVTHGRGGGRINGQLEIVRANYQVGTEAEAEVPEFAVREAGARPPTTVADETRPDGSPAAATPPAAVSAANWQLDMTAVADNQIYVRGMGLDSEWAANLRITGPVMTPAIVGDVRVIRGEYAFAGRRFNLSRGNVRLTGNWPVDPTIDILAEASVEQLTATIGVTGTATRPQISFNSVPPLPQDEVLSRLLFGESVANLSATEALQLATAVASLRRGGGSGGFNPATSLRRATGIDRLRILGANQATGQGASVAAGEYLGDNIYVEVATDAKGNAATNIELELTRSLSILSSIAALGGQSVNLRYKRDY